MHRCNQFISINPHTGLFTVLLTALICAEERSVNGDFGKKYGGMYDDYDDGGPTISQGPQFSSVSSDRKP